MQSMMNAFRELRFVMIHPHSPSMDELMNHYSNDNHILHCWKTSPNSQWQYCILLFQSSRGHYWCHSEFEAELFPNMTNVLNSLMANKQRTSCNQTLDIVSDKKIEWLDKYGDIVCLSLFVYVISQVSSVSFFPEQSYCSLSSPEDDGVMQWLYQEGVLLNHFLQESKKGFRGSVDETMFSVLDLYCHLVLVINQLIKYQSIAESVSQSSKLIANIVSEYSSKIEQNKDTAFAALLVNHSKVFYSMSHCDQLLSALSEFPLSSSDCVQLPFSSEWRDLLFLDIEMISDVISQKATP